MCEFLFFCFFLSTSIAFSAFSKKILLTTSQTRKPRKDLDLKYLKNVKFCIVDDLNYKK